MADEISSEELISIALGRLDCTTYEVRMRSTGGTRLVVSCPHEVVAYLLAMIVNGMGGEVEPMPTRLALGKPVPDGPGLCFWLPDRPTSMRRLPPRPPVEGAEIPSL